MKQTFNRTQLIFAIVMSGVMSVIMTGVITAINTGFGQGYLTRWSHAFALGYPLAFICILLLGGPIRKLVTTLVEHGE